MKWLLALLALTGCAGAATINATSASRANVGTAVAAASPGDTVVVPSGTATWTTILTLTRGIILQGAGAGSTVITNGCTPGFDPLTSGLIGYEAARPDLDEPVEISGFTFDGNWNGGGVAFARDTYADSQFITKVKIHDCAFTRCGNVSFPGRAIIIDGLTFGVIYSCTFTSNQKTADFEGSDNFGWAITDTPGGANFMYMEDCTITNADTRCGLITSGGQGGRYVVRHCMIDTSSANADNQHFDIHGNLSDRGSIAGEIYANTITTHSGAYQLLDDRGGRSIVANNKVIKTGVIELQLREEDTGSYPLLDQVNNSFIWHNTYGTSTGLENAVVPFVAQGATYVQIDRDYFVPATTGLEADLPGTGSDGAYYGTTDTNKIFKCHPANTWTVFYTPYTYPHPLRGSSGRSSFSGSGTTRFGGSGTTTFSN